MYEKERPGVVGASIFLGLILTGTIVITTVLWLLNNTFFSAQYYRDILSDKKVISSFTDYLNDGFAEILKKDYPNINIKDEIFSDDLSEQLLSIISDHFLEDELSKGDLEELYNILDGDLHEYYAKNSDILPDDFLNTTDYSSEKFIDDFTKSMGDNDTEFVNKLPEINSTVSKVTVVFIGISLFIILILVLIHSRKYRSLRVIGICTLMAGIGLTILGFGIRALLINALKTESPVPELGDFANKLLIAAAKPYIIIFVSMLVIGIALIVITNVIDKKERDNYLARKDMYFNNNSAQVNYDDYYQTSYNTYTNTSNSSYQSNYYTGAYETASDYKSTYNEMERSYQDSMNSLNQGSSDIDLNSSTVSDAFKEK